MSFKQLNIQIHHPKLNYSYRVVPPSKLLYNPPFHYKKTPQQWNWRSSNTNSPNKLSINIHPAYSYYFGYVYQYPIKPVGGVSSPTAGRLVMASPSFSWPKPSPVLPMRRGDHRPGRFSSAVAKRDMIRAWRGSDWGNRENGGIWRMGHLWTKIYIFRVIVKLKEEFNYDLIQHISKKIMILHRVDLMSQLWDLTNKKWGINKWNWRVYSVHVQSEVITSINKLKFD